MTTDLVVDEDAWSVLSRLSRVLHVKEAGLQPTLDAIVVAATQNVPGADYAGLNLFAHGKFEPQAVIGGPPPKLDALQKRLGTGPCIDASRDQVVVRVESMSTETRWPDFARLGVALGVSSMLCLPLWVDEQRLGSLSMYSTMLPFDETAERLASLLAVHAALALSEAQRTEQLRVAIQNRDIIGQAKGILMERHHITAEAAFGLLAQASQRANRRLAAIADDVAQTGRLPQ